MRRVNIKAVLVRHRLLVLAAIVVCSGVGATQALSASAGTSAPPVAPSPFAAYLAPSTATVSPAQVLAIARSEAAKAGEPNPTISVGKGSFADAMRSIDPSTTIPTSSEPGEEAMFATPVSLVTLQGSFTLQDARVPPGVPAPKGSVLELIINEHTSAVMGRALPSPEVLAAAVPLANTASVSHWNDGTIVGSLRVGGGPPGKHPTSSGAGHARVVVMSLAHRVVARTTTRSNGGFSIRVRAGRYLVAGTVSQVCPANRVRVRAGRIVSTRLSCSIK
jgi:hypothetical protein